MWISLSTVSGTFRRARATHSHSCPVMWLLNSKQSKAVLLEQKSSSKLIHPFPPTNFSKEIMKFFTIYQTNFTNPSSPCFLWLPSLNSLARFTPFLAQRWRFLSREGSNVASADVFKRASLSTFSLKFPFRMRHHKFILTAQRDANH